MTILLLSSTGRDKTPYDEWFADAAENVILFCPNEKKDSYAEADFLMIEGFDNYVANPKIEIRALELSQIHDITHVLSISEFDVVRAAKLRALLGIEGQSLMSAEAYRDKVLMKQLLHGSSVKIPKFDRVIDAKNVQCFVGQYGLPVVIKPVDGSGSSNVVIARSQQDIDQFLSTPHDLRLFEVEQYIQGQMYHVDGLVHQEEVQYAYVSHYYNGCLEFQHNQPLSSYMLQVDNPLNRALQEEVKKVIAALPSFANGSFHAEFFVTPDNEIYFCEIGSRTGGGEIGKTIAHVTGIQLNQASLYLQLGIENQLPMRKQFEHYAGFILLPPQSSVFKGIREELDEAWVVSRTMHVTPGQTLNDARHSTDFIISVVVEGEDECTLIERIDKVIAWYDTQVIWG